MSLGSTRKVTTFNITRLTTKCWLDTNFNFTNVKHFVARTIDISLDIRTMRIVVYLAIRINCVLMAMRLVNWEELRVSQPNDKS